VFVLLLALVCSLPAALSAQVVRGLVRDSASGAPAAGVLVALIDGTSGERRTVLTDESGQFTIAAARAGSFTLETKRIGVRPVLTPQFSLAAGETRQFDMAVAAVAARLAAVRVTGKSYCADRLKEGGETATLWEEIRAALTATLITRERRAFPVTISRFRRVFDPKGLQVRSEERSEQSGLTSNPFTSVPIPTLSSEGYIVPDTAGQLSYRAPDVDALLSDMFVRDHCFRMVEGTGNKRGLLGLAFQPTSARRVPDIAGVIWLDEASRELRRLEFNYTDDPSEGLWPRFPSYIDYARLPSGAWIIQRWSIRMPLVELERRDPTNPLLAGQGTRRRLVAILEEGAEASVGHRQPGVARALAGTVFDSSAGRPLAGARVSLRGTPFGAESDAGGRFRVQLPDSGTYLLAFDHPRLDSLGYDVPARAVRVVDTLTTADVAVPPLAKVRSELCPGLRGGSTTAVVLGTIRTAGGAPAAWATLRYRWSRFEAAPMTEGSPLPAGAPIPVLQSAPGATLVADSRGRYVICDVPAGRYRLSLESPTGEVAESDVKVDAGEIVVRDLTLRR
jgi:hypothetical protein